MQLAVRFNCSEKLKNKLSKIFLIKKKKKLSLFKQFFSLGFSLQLSFPANVWDHCCQSRLPEVSVAAGRLLSPQRWEELVGLVLTERK